MIMTLQDCWPLAAMGVRLQGEGMADLLYADSLPALHGFGYMEISVAAVPTGDGPGTITLVQQVRQFMAA